MAKVIKQDTFPTITTVSTLKAGTLCMWKGNVYIKSRMDSRAYSVDGRMISGDAEVTVLPKGAQVTLEQE